MLIRKIKSIGCWDPATIKEKIEREDATTPGDTIADLKTEKNRLSVWYTPNTEEENIYPIIAAIATNRESLQKMTYVVLDEGELSRLGIEYVQTDGIAPGITNPDILQRHHDLINIDYKRIGLLAEYIHKLIEKKNGETISDKKMIKFINRLIDEGSISKEELKPRIKDTL